MPSTLTTTVASFAATTGLLFAACLGRTSVQCEQDSNCDLATGGLCVKAPTGNQWCAYPDTDCGDGYRYSNDDVGDGVGGACVADSGFKLTIMIGGSGTGSVVSPGAVCAQGACTQMFPIGTQIRLTQTATTGTFLGWSNDCSGPDDCMITMDRDRKVGALFGTMGQALWVQQIGGPMDDAGLAIATDGDGNVIAVGAFSGSIQLNASTTLHAAGMSDMYVEKLDGSTGDVIWAKSFGGTANDTALGVAVDDSNNVYVTGNFQGTIDFGDGASQAVGGVNDNDAFVLKLTTSGDFVWSRKFGSSFPDSGVAIAARDNAIAVIGYYAGMTTVGGTVLTPAGQVDIFVTSLTPDGNFSWAKSMGGTKIDDPAGVAIDSKGNVVVVGDFAIAASFGGAQLPSAGGEDMFVAKLAGGNGAHLFSKGFGSTGDDFAKAVAVDADDNIAIVGGFHGTVDFGGPTPLSDGTADTFGGGAFLAKYTTAGAYIWALPFVGTGAQQSNAVTINATGDVAVAGTFCGTISFGGPSLSSANGCAIGQFGRDDDVFAARFSSADGSHLDSVRAGGTDNEFTTGVAQTADGRYYVTGSFQGFAEFGGQSLTSAGGTDAFVLGLAPL